MNDQRYHADTISKHDEGALFLYTDHIIAMKKEKMQIAALTKEKKKMEEMMLSHAARCRGWFGDDPVWEQFAEYAKTLRGEEEVGMMHADGFDENGMVIYP